MRDAGHIGWVNLNTIINEDGIWPLEFTCRFGYPGFAVLEPLQRPGWGDLFRAMLERAERFDARLGYSVCVVISTPPFPLSRHEVDYPVGLPLLIGSIDPHHLHLGEVGLAETHLVTSGLYGWTAVVTGVGSTVEEASTAAYENAGKICAPNGRYRLDIGDKLARSDLAQLQSWGWLNPNSPTRIASQIVR
jgi:phosphoribosylamine--glycine ligase